VTHYTRISKQNVQKVAGLIASCLKITSIFPTDDLWINQKPTQKNKDVESILSTCPLQGLVGYVEKQKSLFVHMRRDIFKCILRYIKKNQASENACSV